MGSEAGLETLKKVATVAAMAGLKGRIDQGTYRMDFNTGNGRSQTVYVRETGTTPDKHHIITLFSPAVIMKKGFFAGISKDQAIGLLRLNESSYFARFGIWETDTKSMIVASCDLVLDNLEPDALKVQAYYVAYAADKYEAQSGSDHF